MKRNYNVISKAISLLLALTMLMSVSSTVFAADAVENGLLVEASAPQLLGSSTAGWALEKLAGGVLSGVAGKGVNAAFAAIFGNETDAILAKLDEISQKMDRINDNLDALRKKYAEGPLNTALNEYQSFIGPYEALFELLMVKSEAFADKPAETKEFLMDIYRGDKANYRIGGDNMLMLTLKLSKELLKVNNNEYNLFGAFDKLDRHVHRWEHQGYESRQEFRDSVLTFYTAFMTLSQLACKTAMEDVPKDSYLYLDREAELTDLKNKAILVDQMNKRCAIIQHPDLRIFRDTVEGEDLFAFYPRVDVSYMPKPTPPYRTKDVTTNEYIRTWTTTNHILSREPKNGGTEVISAQVWASDLQYINTSYGGNKDYMISFLTQTKEVFTM